MSNTTRSPSGWRGGGTSLWDLATGKERKLDTDHAAKGPEQNAGTNSAWMYTGTWAVAFAPDGKTLATGGRDGLVKLWDVASGRHLLTLEQQYAGVAALAFSRDGRTVASATCYGAIRLWDVATGKDLCPQPGHLDSVWRAVLSPDGKTAVTAKPGPHRPLVGHGDRPPGYALLTGSSGTWPSARTAERFSPPTCRTVCGCGTWPRVARPPPPSCPTGCGSGR